MSSAPSLLRATSRIVYDSFAYRLRMREANNLPVVISLAIAFRLPWLDVAVRALMAVILNVLVYLTNDYLDIDIDLRAGDKPSDHTAFLAEHRRAARLALVALWLLLGLAGAAHQHLFSSWIPALGAFGGALTVWVYSAWLKHIALLDVISMAVAGALGAAVGIAPGDLGYRIVAFLGLICGSFNAMQVIRDLPSDAEHEVRTTAVVFGTGAAALLYRSLLGGAAIFGALVVGSGSALALIAALPWPINARSASRAWDVARVAGALSWAGLLVELYLGRLH